MAVLYGVFAQFSSKISPKNVTFYENCSCIKVFTPFPSEISPFVLFFDKKQQNKDDVPGIKNVTFCENCVCIIWGFCSIFV